MEFKDELMNVLAEMGLPEPQIQLETASGGRVGGYIISKGFEGKSQIDRQNLVWTFLDERLPEGKRLRIISILTLTPDEAGLAA